MSFVPWVEDSDGDFYSVDSAHTLCQDTFVAAFAGDECELYNSLYSVGVGLIILGIILLLGGIMPRGGRQHVIVQNPKAPPVNRQYSPEAQQPVKPHTSDTERPAEDMESPAPQNKFCTNCGTKLDYSANFCTDCGTKTS